jgi:hypothetical protein
MASMPRLAVLTATLTLTAASDAAGAGTVTVRDPGGGPRWTATESTRSGRTCVTVRRGRSRIGTSCARLTGDVVYSYVTRTRSAPRARDTRTVLIATFAPSVTRASLRLPGGRSATYRFRGRRPRVLLAVLAGRVERPTLTMDVRTGSRTTRLTEGPPPAVQVADPQGGPAFRSRTAAASGEGDVCITWERVPPRFEATPQPARGTISCGRSEDDVPVAAAQRVEGRVVVYGLAGAGVRSAVLRGPNGDETLALEPKTRALLAVLPAGSDPAALKVVVRLGDGREVERPLDVIGG